MKTEKILAILCGIYLFFLSTTISTAGYSISCALLIICLLWSYFKYKRKWVLPNRTFCILYTIFFLSLFIAAIGIGDKKAFFATVRYFYLSLPFWILYSVFLNIQVSIKRFWCVAVFLAAIIPAAYGFYQFFTFPAGARIDSFTAHPNTFATILSFLIPFMLAITSDKALFEGADKRLQTVYQGILFFCIFFVTMVMLTGQSRGAIAGFILGGSVIVLCRWRLRAKKNLVSFKIIGTGIAIIVLISGALFAFMTTFGGRSYDNERILLAKSSYHMWSDHKVFGVGFDNWKKEYQTKYILPEAKEPNLAMSHNTITGFYSMTGIVGGTGYMIFSIGIFIFLLKRIWQYPENPYLQAMLWAYIVVFVEGMVNAGIKDKFVMRMLFGYLGFTLALIHQEVMKRKGMIQNDEIVKLCEKQDM